MSEVTAKVSWNEDSYDDTYEKRVLTVSKV